MEPGYSDAFRLGRLCKREHRWKGMDATLRVNGRCPECDQDRAIARRKRPQAPRLTPQERRRLYKAKVRAELRNQGLTSKGTVPVRADGAVSKDPESRACKNAIRDAGQCPSVARLVMDAQIQHWRENPKDYAEFRSRWAQSRWWLRYATTPDLRLYHREKSKRRKAQNRGQTPVQITVAALRQRFNEFGNCCAYCGDGGDMQIEHLEPISKGGAHDIGNIVPACASCNTSKRSHPMERWYRAQPFFSELRLQRIRRVMRPPEAHQLALAMA